MFMLNALPGTAQNNDFAGNWNVVLDTQNLYMTMDNNLQAVIYNNVNNLVRSADINGQMISSTHLMGTWIARPNITDQGTVNIYQEGKDKFSGNLVWDDGLRATFRGTRAPK